MPMPNDLVLVRHGESDGNVVTHAARQGDLTGYTEAFATTPGHQWRLTAMGRLQAAVIGAWVTQTFPALTTDQAGVAAPGVDDRAVGDAPERPGTSFDRCYVSPYVRTRETAGHMGLPGSRWLMNRALRERDWGDIGSMPRQRFAANYPDNARMKERDPLYWAPPGGESIAHVAEDRVRNVLATLQRECEGGSVLMVTHGELMWAFRMVLERWNDEDFCRYDKDEAQKIHNCMAWHYTRVNPVTGAIASRLSWVRSATPVIVDGRASVVVTPFRYFPFAGLSSEELLTSVENVPSLP